MSKNNPENRQVQEVKKYSGKPVKPVRYIGKHKGHGNYMAAMYENGQLVQDPVKKQPIPFNNI